MCDILGILLHDPAHTALERNTDGIAMLVIGITHSALGCAFRNGSQPYDQLVQSNYS